MLLNKILKDIIDYDKIRDFLIKNRIENDEEIRMVLKTLNVLIKIHIVVIFREHYLKKNNECDCPYIEYLSNEDKHDALIKLMEIIIDYFMMKYTDKYYKKAPIIGTLFIDFLYLKDNYKELIVYWVKIRDYCELYLKILDIEIGDDYKLESRIREMKKHCKNNIFLRKKNHKIEFDNIGNITIKEMLDLIDVK